MKRKFDGKEMSIAVKNLEGMKEELEYNVYQKQICDLKLESGLKIEMLKQVRDYKKLKREFEADISILKDKISLLENQIRNGVDVKENDKEMINKTKTETKLEKEE
jgi:hypothetical protein